MSWMLRGLVVVILASGCDVFFPLHGPNSLADGPVPDPDGGGAESFKRVFVTASLFSGDLGGLGGANLACETEAIQAMMGGTFVARLSTRDVSANSRLVPSAKPYVLVSDTLVANNFADLSDSMLDHPIDLTVFGDPPQTSSTACNDGTGVWSNTTGNGAALSDNDCGGWMSSNRADNGNSGNSTAMDGTWSDDPSCRGIPCDERFPLYCIEQ